MGTTGWDDFCAALDGKFVLDPDMDFVSYDDGMDMVTIAEDLMVPVPVYNYARYIKEVSRFRAGYAAGIFPYTSPHFRTMSLFAPMVPSKMCVLLVQSKLGWTLIVDGTSVSAPMMTRSSSIPTSTRFGGFGYSKFARSGDTFRFVELSASKNLTSVLIVSWF